MLLASCYQRYPAAQSPEKWINYTPFLWQEVANSALELISNWTAEVYFFINIGNSETLNNPGHEVSGEKFSENILDLVIWREL